MRLNNSVQGLAMIILILLGAFCGSHITVGYIVAVM